MLKEFAGIISTYAFNLQLLVTAVCLVAVLHDFGHTRGRPAVPHARGGGQALIALRMLCVAAALYAVSFGAFCLFRGTPVSSIWQHFAALVVFVVYTAFFCKSDIKIRVVLAATLFSILFIAVETGGMMSFLLFDAFSSQAVRSLCLIFVLAYAVVAKTFDLNKYDTIFGSLLAVDIFFNLMVSVIVCINSYVCMNMAVPTWFNAVIMYSMLAIAFVIYLMTYAVAKSTHTNLMLFIENNFSKINAYTIELLQKKSEDLRCIRHDIRNQFAYMAMLLEDGRYDELKNYFGTLDRDFSATDSYIETGNLAVNSVVNMMAQKAAAKGLTLKCNAAVPEKLPFSDVDICSLFSNLLDNAVESCVRQKIAGAQIEADIAVRGQSLYVCVKNPVGEGTDIGRVLKLRTEKAEAGHGLGTKIIRRIVKKYGGGEKDCTFSVNEGKFTAEVMLYYPAGEGGDQ